MTVLTTQARYQYSGNGSTASFGFPAVFINPADLVVTVQDTGGLAVATTLNGGGPFGYTLDGTRDAATGEYLAGAAVVFGSPPPAGYTITIHRDPPATQTMALVSGGKFLAETVNTEADKGAMIDQFHRDWLERAVTAPIPDPPGAGNVSMFLPPVAARAGQIMGFDAAGRPAVGGNLDSLVALLAAGWTPALTGIDWTPSITGLRALTPPASFAVVALVGYYSAGDKAPVLYGYSTSDSRADDGGLVIKPASVGGGSPGRWLLLTLGAPFNVQDWGADPTNSIASDSAFGAWFAACLSHATRGRIPGGRYKFAAAVYWNLDPVAANGIAIEGDGYDAVLDFSAVAASPNLLIGGSTDLFKSSFTQFSVIGNIDGTVLQLGNSSYATGGGGNPLYHDALNVFTVDLNVVNAHASGSPVAVEIDHYLNSPYTNLIVNCAGVGTALRLRQALFCAFHGSFSTAAIGLHFIDGYAYGNSFNAVDSENIVGYCLRCDSQFLSGNVFLGGTFVWRNGVTNGQAILMNQGNNSLIFLGTQFSRSDGGSPHPIVTGAKKDVVLILIDSYGTWNFAALNVAPRPESPADAYVVPIIPDSAHVGGMLIQRLIATVPKARWSVLADNAAEGGGNAGTDFKLSRFDDGGAVIDDPLVARRATGVVEILHGLQIQAASTLGLYGAVPVTQPGASGSNSPASAGAGAAVLIDTTFTGGVGATGYTLGKLIAALKSVGIIAS